MHTRLAVTAALLLAILASCSGPASQLPAIEAREAELSGEAAYKKAVELQLAGRHVESVPLFRRAAQTSPHISRLHLEYGQALHNASIQTDLRFGFVRYVVPSSQERTALANEAILEARESVQLARTRDERAYALFTLARFQSLMGLHADALEAVMTARELAPDVAVLREFESSQRLILEDAAGGGTASEGAARGFGQQR